MRNILLLLSAVFLLLSPRAHSEISQDQFRALADAACAYNNRDLQNNKRYRDILNRCWRAFRLGLIEEIPPEVLEKLSVGVLVYELQYDPKHELVVVRFVRNPASMWKITLDKTGVIADAFESEVVLGPSREGPNYFRYLRTNLEDPATLTYWKEVLADTLALFCIHKKMVCPQGPPREE